MSTLKVEVLKIDNIIEHPNAQKLEIAVIKGWNCVVQKDLYKAGDLCCYIPIDSVLPKDLENKIFPPDSKIKLSKSRIRTIRIRGLVSQGLVCPLDELDLVGFTEGSDVTERLGITKYEPPVDLGPQSNLRQAGKKQIHPDFSKYTSIENYKNFHNIFASGESCIITEKIHGSNWRAGILDYNADTIWKKLKRFFGFAPKTQFCYGSHNVQLQNGGGKKGFYKQDIYNQMVEKYDIENKLKHGEIIYGEVYGSGVQKNYDYGCETLEKKLVIFDLKINGVYQDHETLEKFCKERDLPLVPILYKGPFNEAHAKKLATGDSILSSAQKVKEGVVIRSPEGHKLVKLINDDYLLKEQSDFH